MPIIDADRRWQWCMELLEGLKYLHENNIVHRDVQPSNVLVSRTNTYVIADRWMLLFTVIIV